MVDAGMHGEVTRQDPDFFVGAGPCGLLALVLMPGGGAASESHLETWVFAAVHPDFRRVGGIGDMPGGVVDFQLEDRRAGELGVRGQIQVLVSGVG